MRWGRWLLLVVGIGMFVGGLLWVVSRKVVLWGAWPWSEMKISAKSGRTISELLTMTGYSKLETKPWIWVVFKRQVPEKETSVYWQNISPGRGVTVPFGCKWNKDKFGHRVWVMEVDVKLETYFAEGLDRSQAGKRVNQGTAYCLWRMIAGTDVPDTEVQSVGSKIEDTIENDSILSI